MPGRCPCAQAIASGKRIASVPVDLRVRGGQHPHHAPRGAAEVESRLSRLELEARGAKRVHHQVGVVVGAAGGDRSPRHRGHLVPRHGGREPAALERGLHVVMGREREHEPPSLAGAGRVPQLALRGLEPALDGIKIVGREPVVEQVGDRRRVQEVGGEPAREGLAPGLAPAAPAQPVRERAPAALGAKARLGAANRRPELACPAAAHQRVEVHVEAVEPVALLLRGGQRLVGPRHLLGVPAPKGVELGAQCPRLLTLGRVSGHSGRA